MNPGNDYTSRRRWIVTTAIAAIAGIAIPLYLSSSRNAPGHTPETNAASSAAQSPLAKPPRPKKSSSPPQVRGTAVRSGVDYTKCLTVGGSRFTNGTAVFLDECDAGVDGQEWIFTGKNQITLAAKSSMCFDLDDGSLTTGTLVVVNECVDSDTPSNTQLWTFQPGHAIRNLASGMCLDVPYSRAENGTRVQIVACATEPDWPPQKWVAG